MSVSDLRARRVGLFKSKNMDTFGPIVSVMVGASHDVAEVGSIRAKMTGPGLSKLFEDRSQTLKIVPGTETLFGRIP